MHSARYVSFPFAFASGEESDAVSLFSSGAANPKPKRAIRLVGQLGRGTWIDESQLRDTLSANKKERAMYTQVSGVPIPQDCEVVRFPQLSTCHARDFGGCT